jgi:hypothetical protein
MRSESFSTPKISPVGIERDSGCVQSPPERVARDSGCVQKFSLRLKFLLEASGEALKASGETLYAYSEALDAFRVPLRHHRPVRPQSSAEAVPTSEELSRACPSEALTTPALLSQRERREKEKQRLRGLSSWLCSPLRVRRAMPSVRIPGRTGAAPIFRGLPHPNRLEVSL